MAEYIVLDANVWVDFILQDEKARKVVETVVRKYIPIQSERTMKEVEHVTGQARFAKALSPDDRKDLLEFVKNLADFREQTHFPTPSKDADDNMYLGLAMQVGAQQIVTNDTDLRELKHYLGIQIWSPEQFIARESTLEAEKGQ